jgi:putative spermidine/putrescine transport system substrate-binding protein
VNYRKSWTLLAASTALILAASACTGGDEKKPEKKAEGPPKIAALEQLGEGEGTLDLVARAGYVENGSTDPKVDWVTPFEQASGCKVNVTVADTSEEALTLMRSRKYDAVAASGDISGVLIEDGVVAPVNTALVPNYADVVDGLKDKPWNSFKGTAYGVPHGRGANLLMWRTDVVKPAPQSWDAVFAAGSPHAGKITAHDSPMSIADGAVYLMKTRPDLQITDPYALDETQFNAVVDLMKQQRGSIAAYWTDYTSQVQAFKSGSTVIGSTWQSIASLAQTQKLPVQSAVPTEGTTGWSDTWMVGAKAKHPNCAYKWFDHVLTPKVNAQVAEWFGQAPANRNACAQTADKAFCTTFHATDEPYFQKVWYWRTPAKKCVDGRDVECKDREAWVKAWSEIKG